MRGKKMERVSEEWLRAEYKIKTRDQIARDLGVGRGTVYRWMKFYGIEGRKRAEYVAGKKTKHLLLDDKEWLYDLYINQKKSIKYIAHIIGCTGGAIWWSLHKHGIEIRTSKEGQGIFQSTRGPEDNPNWKGGRYIGGNKRRYIMVRCVGHPKVSKQGYILEHRLIMEKHLGRFLESTEYVHHMNGNGHDNRLSNLRLVTKQEHQQIHLGKNDVKPKEHIKTVS